MTGITRRGLFRLAAGMLAAFAVPRTVAAALEAAPKHTDPFRPQTITLSPSGAGDDWPRIKAAFDSLPDGPGHTLRLRAGTYYVSQPIVITERLPDFTIQGGKPAAVFTRCARDSGHTFIDCRAVGSRMTHLSVRQPGT